VTITQVSPAGAAATAGALAGDGLVSIGDVMISNDDSFDAFRARYAGTTLTTVPLVVRRGAETITLRLPVRLTARVRTRLLPVPNASEKAARIREGILRGLAS
jgi:S1-C subfamily serine protease